MRVVDKYEFDLQPTLIGDLVECRPLRDADFDELFRVASDPEIWAQHPSKERATRAGFRIFFGQSLESGGSLCVRDVDSGCVIGSSRYHGYDPKADEVEIGWTFLARSYWGGVYNGDLKRLMLLHAFQTVSSIVFLIAVDNIRSQRAIERIGAVRDGLRRNGTGQPHALYRIKTQDYFGGS